MNLTTPVAALNRVGKTIEKRLKYLGLHTLEDILYHFPFRYEDYRRVASIGSLKEGEQVTIHATIELIANKRSPRKRTMITEAVVADDSGQARIVWFGQPFITQTLRVGNQVFFSGKVERDLLGICFISPAYERDKADGVHPTHTARLVPIYPLTQGITQKQLRYLLSQIMPVVTQIQDWLPEEIRRVEDFLPLSEALRGIHFPENEVAYKQAERRLKFDELFLLQLRSEMIRQSLARATAPVLPFREAETKAFVSRLPYTLTPDQKIAAWEILKSLGKPRPMNRLLEGEVGSGKTVVAGMAAFTAALSRHQTVFMAPTEILASQHYDTITRLFSQEQLTVALFTRTKCRISGHGEVKRKEVYERIQSGQITILIGTHALLSEEVVFHQVGLVVVDEQHRFGVVQRKIIRDKINQDGQQPHFLSMTATPIPRSLALTIYGDLDISMIRTLPYGRCPIVTRVVAPHERAKAYAFMREQVRLGRQAFVICPLIEPNQEESQSLLFNEKKSVLSEYKKLSEQIFTDLRVGYVHGKMKTKEKDAVMAQFSSGQIDILVSTSVVEVGIDVPNATVMMIEGAERFGLAQLHQFRGRVGRSTHQSYCLLFSDSDSERSSERLAFFAQNHDGFALAEYDLRARGPGEVYGTEQSGLMQLRLASLRDVSLIKRARELAQGIDFNKYPTLIEKVQKWWREVHLE